MTALQGARALPEQGNLVRVRDRFWVVEAVQPSQLPRDALSEQGLVAHHAVRLVPIDDRGTPDPLTVFWELEPGTEIRPQAALPDPAQGIDDGELFAAFLDAVRWGAIASADPSAFQSPFRAGIDIEDYQLLPLVRALQMPRVTMLIADDVGLGKTIEAGLIAEELVLRSQVQKIVIICPPTLCRQWQREMREKFGLGFEVIDTEYVHRLRRQRGVGVNPFRSHPRIIMSLEWVKFDSQMRWFDELLPPDPNEYPRAFDLLIVDEAHQIAPAAVGRYAKDSLRTQAVRRLAPYFEHRLFLTATPHNGYSESFQSLLETLDPNRFAKGVAPSDRDRDAVVVRRLKSHLRELLPDGKDRFPTRVIEAIEVTFTEEEREIHALLDKYIAATQSAASGPDAQAAARFTALWLKKRLLSSPAAFKHSLDTHAASIARKSERRATAAALEVAVRALEEEAESDAQLAELEAEALAIAAAAAGETPTTAAQLLRSLRAKVDTVWRRPDSKTEQLITWIGDVCYPDGEWSDERIIIFTEYRDTLNYLYEALSAPDPARPRMDDRIEVFDGSTSTDERERIIREFNYNPHKTRVRILLATDAASEGIDLHLYCHRLLHTEVSFNPNKMEQRNGRVDRHGQKSPVVSIFHFAGAAGDEAAEFDHTFLLRVAEKLNDMREDLGAVAPVLAGRIEARMLGDGGVSLDIEAELRGRRERAQAELKRIEQRFSEDLAQVRQRYDDSIAELDLTPETLERGVRVALRIETQPDLQPATLSRPGSPVNVFNVPDLTGTWGETLAGLANEVEEVRLPVTFDPQVAAGHHDVAYLHAGHPFVARCLRTLRAQVWGAAVDRKIKRVAVRYADVDEPVAVAHARVVVNGADGSILDEVIEPSAVRVAGRQARLNVGETRAAVAAAHDTAPPAHIAAKYVDQWDRIRPALEDAMRARANDVQEQRARRMDEKRNREEARLRGTLGDLRVAITRRLDELERSEEVAQLRLFDADDRRQFDADMKALRARIDRIDADVEAEVDNLRRRYAVREVHWFPVAVELLVPVGET